MQCSNQLLELNSLETPRSQSKAAGYEWRSQRTWQGSPLVHIAFGMDDEGKLRTARGVIAIGQRAFGGLAIGIIAAGGIAVGIISAGGIAFGVVSVALLLACGVNALAPLAIGVVAAGYAAGGVHAIGWKILFSVSKEVL